MADYWKSQPRKFCQYCKCWIADNKPSVEFHERGKNHKENVAAKISEIKKKSIDKAKQEEKQSKAFAAMEEAAMKAYQEDLKRMEREAAGLPEPTTITTAPKPPPRVVNVTKEEWKKQQKKAKEEKKPGKQTAAQVWVEGQTNDGHTYYYNTITGESQWEKPGGGSASTQPPQTQSSSGGLWLEATSPEGYTYYYNTDTGESSWEKPADFPSYGASGSNKEGDGEEKEKEEKEPEPPQPEPLSGGEESSSGAPASQEAEVPEQANKKSNVPKISFRKRKVEAEPSEKEGEDKETDDASTEVRKEEEQQRTTAEPEEKKEEKKEEKVTQAKKPKTTNPYGSWEQIQQEEDPYASLDLQLPQVEGSSTGAPDELPPEPKPKFKERVITSLGDEGGPASFRKTKTQNGRYRSIRQRDNDD